MQRAVQLHGAKRWLDAAQMYERTLELRAGDARALCGLGLVRCETGDADGGLELIQSSVAGAPQELNNRLQLALRYRLVGRNEEALTEANRILASDRRHLRALRIAAYCYERLNRLEEAEETLEGLLAQDPTDADALLVRARVWRRGGRLEEARDLLEELLQRALDVDHHVIGWFELGRVHDLAGRYGEAMKAFTEGSRIRAGSPEVHKVPRVEFGPRLAEKSQLPAELLRPRHSLDAMRPRPVFLVGFPRSGTTLLERTLGEHPDITTSDELGVLMELRARHEGDYPEVGGLAARLAALDLATAQTLRQEYREGMQATVPNFSSKAVLVDKNPLNLMELPWIAALFPDAKVLVALRDPRDTCLSAFLQDFRLDVGTIELLHLRGAVSFYTQVLGFWTAVRERFGLPWLEVRYEDLVEDPEAKAREVLEFLDLPWHENVNRIQTRGSQRVYRSASYAAVSEPVYRRAVKRWKNYEESLQPFAADLAPFIHAFGYSEGESSRSIRESSSNS